MATDGHWVSAFGTTATCGTNATNSNTNKPTNDHSVPLRATQDHQSTNKRPVKFLVTPHALKLPGHAQPEIRAANQAHEGQRRTTAILVTTALRARQGRPGGTPLCGRGALTAARRREGGSAFSAGWRGLSCITAITNQ